MSKDPSLQAAYALNGADDVRDLYRSWAKTYDTGFALDQGYRLPTEVAQAYAAAGGAGPVLDVGAGTGLVGAAMAQCGISPIDGVDLSPEMLQVAGQKQAYRALIEADITRPLPGVASYAGIVSAGTFTLGHVGPKGIVALIDSAKRDTLFVISVNARHFQSAGFAAMLDANSSQIADLHLQDVAIYDPGKCDPAHRDDAARLLIFRTR